MSEGKRACLVYVSATEGGVADVRGRLEANDYKVCEVKADLDDALAAQTGEVALPTELTACIEGSELCVFLLPDEQDADGLIGPAAEGAGSLDKTTICVVAGDRTEYPQGIEDHAGSVIREGNHQLDDAICGEEIWQAPDGSPVPPRNIKHIRCQ